MMYMLSSKWITTFNRNMVLCTSEQALEMGVLWILSSLVIFLDSSYDEAFAHTACSVATWPNLAQGHHICDNFILILYSLAHSYKIVLLGEHCEWGLLKLGHLVTRGNPGRAELIYTDFFDNHLNKDEKINFGDKWQKI